MDFGGEVDLGRRNGMCKGLCRECRGVFKL